MSVRTTLPYTYKSAVLVWLNHSGGRAIIFLISVSLFFRWHFSGYLSYEWLIPVVFFIGRGFMEWFLHYYFWHENTLPIINKKLLNPIARMHDSHHKNPHNIENLLFGYKAIFLVSLLVFFGVFLVVWHIGISLTVLLSFLMILFCYEWCHLVAHSNINPKSRFFKKIINNHRQHHFKNQERHFGVSSTLADDFFDTN